MGFFSAFRKVAKGAAREVSAELGGNRDYLEAVCAAAALTAYADKNVSAQERAACINVVTQNATLGKLFDRQAIEQCIQTMLGRADSNSGRASLAAEMSDVLKLEKGSEMADYVYLVAKDIAEADGTVGPEEQRVLDLIAKRLNVDQSKFEF